MIVNYFNFNLKSINNLNKMKLSIIIPCYNEIKTINEIIKKIKSVISYDMS